MNKETPAIEESPIGEMTKYLNEFDYKDMPVDFRYSSLHEHQYTYNIANGFKIKQQPKD